MISSPSKAFFVLIVSFCVAEGTLDPGGTVSVNCGSAQTFTCRAPGVSIGWNIAGLSGINIPGPFLARNAAYGMDNSRISSTDDGAESQIHVSVITISGFSTSDNGGIIQCVNKNNNNTKGMANISVELRAPTNVITKEETCDTVTLQWDQPSEPNDITTSVSCTPSPGCTECTTSPCTIIGLNPSTKYEFTVTLNSVMCGTSMNTVGIGTRDLRAPANVVATVRSCDTIILQWTQPSKPNDITTSVNCTPPSPGCTACTNSPCTITGLNPSTEYEFTVTLSSGGCGTTRNTATATTMDLDAPTNLRAAVESCDSITLQWTQPSEPNDITTSVSCTPPSPGCAACTTSPCTITHLNPSTEYEFTMTLNSGGCRTSMSTTTTRTMDLNAPINLRAAVESCDSITLQWTQPSDSNDITTSVSCTPPSPGCAECTTSPCTITGLNPSAEYVFAVTLNSAGCRASTNSTVERTKGLGAPTKVGAELYSCDTVVLEWTQPSEPDDITTSVSCTPPSQGCAACTTSPCTINGLNSSSDYNFTVTLNSSVCATSKNTTTSLQIDTSSCVASKSTRNVGASLAPLAALAVLVLFIPLIYPLGVLIARVCCFRDKSYCEVFWCCGCCGKDKSPKGNFTELMKSPHPREEVEYQNVNKGKHIRFVTDGEEDKNDIGNKQEHVVTYETVEQLGDDDVDIITDETVGQQGNEDGITYATLDFSDNRKGNINVVHSIAEEVTYAAV